MIRCLRCVIPNTRPDTEFVDGVCTACLAFERRPTIDWDARRDELMRLLQASRTKNPGSPFDCMVPSSGGKDSTYQVVKLLELGARPLVVTASTCHLTPIGRANIDNLARLATTVEVTTNRRVRATLNRLGLEMVGDISWPEHCAIFTTPFRLAEAMGIPLIFYGENPQEAYGGPVGTDQAREMTRRWVSEFGGFLGLRPADLVGMHGLTAQDMADYQMPTKAPEARAYFLGQFFEWDSHRNANVAIDHGMRSALPSLANWWTWENLDNAQTGLHDHMMYRKYGYGRLAAQISVDIRRGYITREDALEVVRERDGKFPETYAGVSIDDVLRPLEITRSYLKELLDKFTNWALFDGEHEWRPMLAEA